MSIVKEYSGYYFYFISAEAVGPPFLLCGIVFCFVFLLLQ